MGTKKVMPRVPLAVLTCQTNGALAPSVQENIARWRDSLGMGDSSSTAVSNQTQKLSKADKIDVVHFPETAFCRYYYRGIDDLLQHGAAEEVGKGPVFEFAVEDAKRHDVPRK